jgi:hypothetical protein
MYTTFLFKDLTITWHLTEHLSTALDLYPGSALFESPPLHWPSWLIFFVVYVSPSRQMSGILSRSDDAFRPNHQSLIIQKFDATDSIVEQATSGLCSLSGLVYVDFVGGYSHYVMQTLCTSVTLTSLPDIIFVITGLRVGRGGICPLV